MTRKGNIPNVMKQISYTVLEDWQLRVDDIVEFTGISHEHVYYILAQELCERKNEVVAPIWSFCTF